MEQQQGINHRLRIREVREEKKDFKTIVFEEGHAITYEAGQYLTLVRFEGGEEVRRSYSIISSPALNEPLAIGVKRVENGLFSRVLVDSARPGDWVITTGSGGFFLLPEAKERYRQLFFFAAGSGITPVVSLVKTALHTRPELTLVLVYSNASQDKAVYLADLQALQAQFPDRFALELLFSDTSNLVRARLHRDLIFSLLKDYVTAPEEQTLFYTCGPESYMRLCMYTLQEAGIDPESIRKENFYGGIKVKRDYQPPDLEDHTAVITLRDQQYRVPVQYPDSILRAAQRAGLSLPYSCEAGRCGNCVAKCVEGTVWHSYNEVLTEKELQRGLVLTCVGHPVHGDVTLEIG